MSFFNAKSYRWLEELKGEIKEVSAKRLTIYPGQSITVKDQAAYGIIL